ncbi:MAG: NAD(P)H-dependent oxidoreductase subunit E [Schwartzia sp.]|nr:NAD(P)H-dependent oxidoreductase subunit E [Schwartzia sp. (in: firmicutes)]
MQTEVTPEFIITDELAREIDRVLDEHEHDATQIVGVLLDVQDLIEQQYVPQPVAFYVAQKLPIKVSVIYDCLTFYSALSPVPRAKYPVQVCRSIACKVNDSDTLFEAVKEILNIEPGEVTYDGRFTIEEVSCFGACDVAPAIRINGKVHGHLDTPEKVRAVLAEYM